MMLNVTFYKKKDCKDCENARIFLLEIKRKFDFNLIEIDVMETPQFAGDHLYSVPVIEAGPYVIKDDFNKRKIEATIGAALDREKNLYDLEDKKFVSRKERGAKLSGTDKFTIWFSKYYMILISLFLFLYTALPFAAPAFMKIGLSPAAKIIYTVYKPLCHQLGFRSIFLFGEQVFYPRELAGLDEYTSYEDVTGEEEIDVFAARSFIGNQELGYKVAMCQRCIGIYAAMLFFSLIFMISSNRIKSLHWIIWIIVGLVPIGIDGVSQLPSFAAEFLPIWIPIRESVPVFRFVTGVLFGITTAWYLFPMIEEAMLDSRNLILRKQYVIVQVEKNKESEVAQ